MQSKQTLTRKGKVALIASALLLLVGSTIAVSAAKRFTFSNEFQVYDPAEPVVSTSVNHAFIDSKIQIAVNLSAHDGVKKLSGTYSVIIMIWNDTKNSYEPFQTLVSNRPISLTTEPTPLSFTFTTSTPGTYNVDVEFTATAVETA